MGRDRVERTVTQSLLERLRNVPPAHRPSDMSESIQQLKNAVRKDIEWLFNTRRVAEPADEALEATTESLYHYGLPDISSMSAYRGNPKVRLTREIEEALRVFEPRLEDARVSFVEVEHDKHRAWRFVIEGRLLRDPKPERVVFDTVLEVANQEYRVSGRDDA